MIAHWSARRVECAAILGLCLSESCISAQPVVLASAEMGATGRIGGASITTAQFIGWRFETDKPLTVEQVGGHLLEFPDEPGGIFAALVQLASIDAVPLGAPFTPEEVIATTVLQPAFPSDEILVPLSATLAPGSYMLVFGTGLFGATGAGAAHNGDDQPDIPPTNLSSFIFWSVPFAGQPFEWRKNLASHMRFVVEGQVLRIPGDYDLDGEVGSDDYAIWQADFGSSGVLDADGNGDSVVDTADYVVWRHNLGARVVTMGGASGLAVRAPEPATLLLLLIGATGAMFIRNQFVRVNRTTQ